jgi:hypothetical protein
MFRPLHFELLLLVDLAFAIQGAAISRAWKTNAFLDVPLRHVINELVGKLLLIVENAHYLFLVLRHERWNMPADARTQESKQKFWISQIIEFWLTMNLPSGPTTK